jgi:Protein of unknown function (DUF1214)
MQKLTNRYQLIAAALFLVLSAYAVAAQNVTASPQDVRAGSGGSVTPYVQHQRPGPALESNWLPALAEWFGLVIRYYGPQSRGDEYRVEVARSQKLVVTENLSGNRAITEFAW